MSKKTAINKPGKHGELFYRDTDGIPQDAELHDALLDNPEADNFTARTSCAAMIARGTAPNLARMLYGVAPDEILPSHLQED